METNAKKACEKFCGSVTRDGNNVAVSGDAHEVSLMLVACAASLRNRGFTTEYLLKLVTLSDEMEGAFDDEQVVQ